MKIAITGGAGFIGSHLTKACLDARHTVLVIDNLASGCRDAVDPQARFYQVDIRDRKIRTIIEDERPDLVVHLATQYHELPIEPSLIDADVHVRGLLNVLDSCVNTSVSKFIFASDGNNIYGQVNTSQNHLTEDTPVCPHRLHAISKAAGEWYVRYYTMQYGLKHMILRYADVYGETRSSHFHHPLSYFISMLLEQRRPIIRGSGDEIRDHIFIDDVVQASLSALKRGENQTLHISSGQGYNLNQLYRTLTLCMESEIEPIYLSGPLLERPAIILDNSRAQRVLGWRPEVTLHEGLGRSIAKLQNCNEPTMLEKSTLVNSSSVPEIALTGR